MSRKRDERAIYKPVEYADPDLVRAACALLEREWGSYGYQVGFRTAGFGYVELQVRHWDGSEFVVGYRESGSWWHADITFEVPA